jgi:hypothetical protein
MNQPDIVNAATSAAQPAAQNWKNIANEQVGRQSTALGSTLAQTARDLRTVASDLRSTGTIANAAQIADWAANYVDAPVRI